MKKVLNNLCKCGCGKTTRLAPYSFKGRGWKQGKPILFIHGHNMRGAKRIGAMTGKKHSLETKLKMHASAKKGKDSPLWRGGVYPETLMLRESLEYREWRMAVFIRDGFKCVLCGIKGGWSKELKKHIMLNGDHIKGWAKYPEFRFDINNGRTLCVPCHRKTPNYAVNLRYSKEEKDDMVELNKE